MTDPSTPRPGLDPFHQARPRLLHHEWMHLMANTTDAALDSYPGARAARDHLMFDDPHLNTDDLQLIDPGIGGPTGAVVIHLDGTVRWALPKGTRIAPGKGKVYALGPSGRVHILIARDGRVQELVVGLAVARRIRVEMFGANA